MSKISVIYWSQTGNTKAMAELIGKGVALSGREVDIQRVRQELLDELEQEPVFALGCPAMGAEQLEEEEMEPFVEAVMKFAKGKTIALFGSYGWGDGEWMSEWVERLQDAGANIVNEKGLICQEMPDGNVQEECITLGKQLGLL